MELLFNSDWFMHCTKQGHFYGVFFLYPELSLYFVKDFSYDLKGIRKNIKTRIKVTVILTNEIASLVKFMKPQCPENRTFKYLIWAEQYAIPPDFLHIHTFVFLPSCIFSGI